ncbi:MAG TPA: hypothetical protein VE400_22115, partial [Mycobacterium sp.]|nr:hypothetical protein [Mycobacterium sp.]
MKVEKTTSKAWSLALVGATYLVAVGVATLWLGLGVHTGRLWLDTLIARDRPGVTLCAAAPA